MTISNQPTERSSRADQFIDYLIQRCYPNDKPKNKGLLARLRRASNPATEYQIWDILVGFGINLEREPNQRRTYALVAAAFANSRAEKNGELTLGRAIALSFPDGNNSEPANARLRRLLACDSVQEVCQVLRPMLSLIQNRVPQPLDFKRLLSDLSYFDVDKERITSRWADQFYPRATQSEQEQAQ